MSPRRQQSGEAIHTTTQATIAVAAEHLFTSPGPRSTLAYMSPEQALKGIDARPDLFLGSVIYEMGTDIAIHGRHFRGDVRFDSAWTPKAAAGTHPSLPSELKELSTKRGEGPRSALPNGLRN
jgi:hypothetical protein